MYVAVLVFLLSPTVTIADVVLDQAVEVVSGGVNQGYGLAQTFTVGVSGLLVQVDVNVFVAPGQTAQIKILGTLADGSPDVSNVLATAAQNLAVGTFNSIDFSASSIPVNVGDVLAIEIKNVGSILNWYFNNTEVYTSGGAFAVIDGLGGTYAPFNFPSTAPGSDLTFRTFVETDLTPVPDPDTDGDGVLDDDDNCPDTIIPESLPTKLLGTNRFALFDGDFLFDTTSPKGNGPGRNYTTTDTTGCSCTQIIEALGLGNGHIKFGCSISAMDDWVELVN